MSGATLVLLIVVGIALLAPLVDLAILLVRLAIGRRANADESDGTIVAMASVRRCASCNRTASDTEARFCAQCGLTLEEASPAFSAVPSSRKWRTAQVLIALVVAAAIGATFGLVRSRHAHSPLVDLSQPTEVTFSTSAPAESHKGTQWKIRFQRK